MNFCLLTELTVIEVCVEAVLCEQGFVRARFDDLTVVHDEDQVCLADGGKTVRHDKARSAFHHRSERVLNLHFGSGVDGGGRFVEDQHGRERKHNACNAKELLLSLRKSAVLTDDGIVSLGQTLDEAVRVGSLCRGDDLRLGRVRLADRDVFSDGCRFDPRVLKHHAVRAAQAVSRDVADVSVIYEDLAAVHVVEAHEQTDQRGLATARRTDDGNAASVRNVHGKITDEGLILRIGEGDIADINVALGVGQRFGVCVVGDLRLRINELEETVSADDCILKLGYNAGDFVEGLGVLVGVAEENGKTADRECRGVGNDGKRADKSDTRIYDTVDDARCGVNEGGIEHRLERAFFKLAVHSLKGLDRLGFVSVSAYDLFVADDLVDESGLVTADLRLRGEEIVRAACNEACYEQGKGGNEYDDESDLPVDDEHEDERAENGDRTRKELGEAHQQTVGELVCVGNDPADDIAVRLRIAVGYGELLQFIKGGASQIADDAEGDLIVDDALDPLDQCGEHGGDGDSDQNADDDIHVDVAGLDDVVDGFTDGDRNIKGEQNRRGGADKGKDETYVIGADVGQDLSDRALGNVILFHTVTPSFSLGN